jgi:hypothetical protein
MCDHLVAKKNRWSEGGEWMGEVGNAVQGIASAHVEIVPHTTYTLPLAGYHLTLKLFVVGGSLAGCHFNDYSLNLAGCVCLPKS